MFNTKKRAAFSVLGALGLLGMVLLFLTGMGLAFDSGSTPTYTGCLNLQSGALIKIQEGAEPLKPCQGKSVAVSFSAGDVTSILAGAGISSDGDAGDVTVSILPSFQLPQACDDGQVTKWDGTRWECGADTDTQYDGTDFAVSNQACGPGDVVTGVDAAGNVTCAPDVDTDTTYDGSDFAVSNQACGPGDMVTGVDAAGNVTCAPDVDTDTTYDGSDFAVSNQACGPGDVVTGVDAAGNVTCAPDVDTDTTYDGSDFAVSNQACGPGDVVTGVDAAGGVICAPDNDADTDTLASLSCEDGDTPTWSSRFNQWRCAPVGPVEEVFGAGTIAEWTVPEFITSVEVQVWGGGGGGGNGGTAISGGRGGGGGGGGAGGYIRATLAVNPGEVFTVLVGGGGAPGQAGGISQFIRGSGLATDPDESFRGVQAFGGQGGSVGAAADEGAGGAGGVGGGTGVFQAGGTVTTGPFGLTVDDTRTGPGGQAGAGGGASSFGGARGGRGGGAPFFTDPGILNHGGTGGEGGTPGVDGKDGFGGANGSVVIRY